MGSGSYEAFRKAFKCKYCGKVYNNLGHLRSVKCQSHPNGMWKGNHECDSTEAKLASFLNESIDKVHEQEIAVQNIKEMKREREEEIRKTMETRPVYFPDKFEIWDKLWDNIESKAIPDYSVKMQKEFNVNVGELSLNLINHWNEPIAKNTIEDLAKACQWAIENETGEGKRLKTWEVTLEKLKDKINDEEFWKQIYWFMSISSPNEKYESGCSLLELLNQSGCPMKELPNFKVNRIVVRALSNWDEDESEKKKMGAILIKYLSSGLAAIAVRAKIGLEKIHTSWIPFLDNMSDNVITQYDFWADLYCLLRLKLRS